MNIEDLRTEEVDLFTFFEKTPDLVCIANKAGYFKNVNAAVIEKLGYSVEELFAKPISHFIHPDDKDLTSIRRANLLKDNSLLNFQNRYVAKNGKIVWLEWSSIYLSDRELVFAIAKDISIRKKIELEVEEKYIKYKGLAAHFKTSIEEDRKSLAAELHEEIAQLATAIKLDIDWIISNVNEMSDASKDRIGHALAISNLLVETIRRISFSISPNMLDDLGLDATLEWYCNEFSLLNDISCQFESVYDEAVLSREICIDFYRICQDSLSMILNNDPAKKIIIRIEETKKNITLTISGNGAGFDIDRISHTQTIIAMRERAASINSELILKSKTGKGTQVSVAISKPPETIKA
jgi:PAS domain S-box-containing protein